MVYRYMDIDKLNKKSKRKKNQFINELLKRNYCDLMITKEEFKSRHKEEIISMFNAYGWDKTGKMYIEDCLQGHYWYKDPICYKTCLDNLDYTDFGGEFVDIFGEDMLKNEVFLKKIHTLKHKDLNSGW